MSCTAAKEAAATGNKWNKGTDEARCNWLNTAFILPVSPAESICHDSQTFLLFSNTIHFRVNTNKNLWASKNIDLCFLLTASDQLLVPDSGTDGPLWALKWPFEPQRCKILAAMTWRLQLQARCMQYNLSSILQCEKPKYPPPLMLCELLHLSKSGMEQLTDVDTLGFFSLYSKSIWIELRWHLYSRPKNKVKYFYV